MRIASVHSFDRSDQPNGEDLGISSRSEQLACGTIYSDRSSLAAALVATGTNRAKWRAAGQSA